ncbi:MAG: type III pantothenate kinase [Gemmatimonadota bacterium]
MILAIDVGNTETVIGVFRELDAICCWRLATDRRRTGDEHALLLEGFLNRSLVPSEGPVRRAMICSVVPVMDRVWSHACGALKLEVCRVDAGSELPIRLEVEDPPGVGADRIMNTLAAAELYGRDTIVVDLGTATTFDCISADGAFLGGVIAPGPRSGIEHLATVATHLPRVEIRAPRRVIGRRTVDCLDSGVFYSVVDAIDGIVARIAEEWGPRDPLVVATGGLSERLGPHCRSVEKVDPLLTLKGLAAAERHLFGAAGRPATEVLPEASG